MFDLYKASNAKSDDDDKRLEIAHITYLITSRLLLTLMISYISLKNIGFL